MDGEYVDGVKRPKFPHFIRDGKIFDWETQCPCCGQNGCRARDWMGEPALDFNQPPEPHFEQIVYCPCCHEEFALEDAVTVNDRTESLRQYQKTCKEQGCKHEQLHHCDKCSAELKQAETAVRLLRYALQFDPICQANAMPRSAMRLSSVCPGVF